MTPDHAALLAAVFAAPADDLPRLVLADYLEESGEPELVARAHFIRAQVTLATAPRGSAEHAAAAALADRAFDMFGEAWGYDLPRWLAFDGKFAYRRGFVETIVMPYLRFVTHGHELFAAAPVADLRLTRVPAHEEPFAAPGLFDRFPPLARVTALRLGPQLAARGRPWGGDPDDAADHPVLEDLTGCRVLSAVRVLDLSGNVLDGAWAVRFAARLPKAAFAGTLRELDLSNNFFLRDDAANVLATAPGLDRLERLTVRDTAITRDGLRMLRTRFGDRVRG